MWRLLRGRSGERRDVQRVLASDNPFGIEIFDCTAFMKDVTSWSSDRQIAESFLRLRSSTGEQYPGRDPEDAHLVTCELSYPCYRPLSEGPLFKAQEMEDKWDIYLYGSKIYFARSWKGQLVYRASALEDANRLRILQIAHPPDQDPVYAVRAVDFLIKSHVFGRVVPHPLPSDLGRTPAQIAPYSFN